MKTPTVKLGRGSRRTLAALSRTLVPTNVPLPDLDARIIAFVEGFLPYMPRVLARLFPLGLWLFQWGTLLFFCAPLPFSMLSAQAKKRYVFRWQRSALPMRRQLIKGLKALILMAYYEQPEVREHVGYAPDAFIRPLVEERAKRYRARGLAVVTEPHAVVTTGAESTGAPREAQRGVS